MTKVTLDVFFNRKYTVKYHIFHISDINHEQDNQDDDFFVDIPDDLDEDDDLAI